MSSEAGKAGDKPPTKAQAEKSTKSGPLDEERDYFVSKEHVEAGSPADHSVCGEEDPGVGLEFVVRKEK